jgi:ATP-binding cassette, subfamily B (MDR/TAP), member 1
VATFFSGIVIAYVRSWKLALILSSVIPVMVIIVGGGGTMVAKASKRVYASYSSAATLAQEILSSVRTAQAFGSEDKLTSLYDKNLEAAQKSGYRKALAMALVLSSIFTCRYLLFGLAFCIQPSSDILIDQQGRAHGLSVMESRMLARSSIAFLLL